ncbi:MAG: hypothetical protein ABIM97_18765 [Ginsengibacter sp.]
MVVLFAILSLAANFIFKTEHTPLFKWDLYSYQIPPQKTYSFLEVRYNDNELLSFPHTWIEPKKLFFTNTLDYFITMKMNNDTDPLKAYIDNWNVNHPLFKKVLPGLKFYNDTAELKKFAGWYKRYIEQHIKKTVYKIEVYEIKVAWQNNDDVKKLSAKLIYKLI